MFWLPNSCMYFDTKCHSSHTIILFHKLIKLLKSLSLHFELPKSNSKYFVVSFHIKWCKYFILILCPIDLVTANPTTVANDTHAIAKQFQPACHTSNWACSSFGQ